MISYKPHYEQVPFEVPSSWEWATIENIAESNIGLTYKPSDVSNTGVPVFRSNNIQNREICLENLIRVNAEIQSKQYLYNGDLLICARNGSRNLVGKCAIVKHLKEPSSFGAFMAVCRSEYNPWIFICLNSEYFNRYLDASNSTAINQVTQKMLLAFNIPFPPQNEQKRIIKEIKKWFEYIDILEQEKNNVADLIQQTKSKILDLAIHGKLVPQDPADEPAIELLKRINPDFVPADTSHYGQLPNGWYECKLENIVDYEQPQAYIVNSTEYSDKYKTPVLTAGKSFIIGYTNETNGIFNKLPVIIFDDFTTDSKYVDFPFKVKSSAMKILKVNPEVNIKYIALFMSKKRLTSETHKRYWISEYSKLPLPLPPRSEQDKIVKQVKIIFDNLDSITADL